MEIFFGGKNTVQLYCYNKMYGKQMLGQVIRIEKRIERFVC